MCHKETGNYEPAVECLEQVLTDEPDNIDAKILLANVYEAMMDRPRAWKLFNEGKKECCTE